MHDITYNHFTDIKGWQWGNGSNYARSFDLDGRLTNYPLGDTNKGGTNRTISYDAAGRIRAMTHTGNGTGPQAPALFNQTFDYDKLNRLTQFTTSTLSETFSYDANSNRTQVQQGATSYTNDIDPTSNRIQRSSGPGNSRVFNYDAQGNTQSDGHLNFEFALNGRMRSVSGPVGTTSYWYNALGQRVKKLGQKGITGKDATYYVYDEQGRLLGEYDTHGNAIQETVYLDGMPVVVLKPEQGNTVPYYVFADHTNTPRVITRASDNVMVWRWDNADPFGVAAPNESPAGAAAFVHNSRFPGQVFDAESGLYYNYFRDYSPRDGKYITSDPIGLQAGVNTYTYVRGNPVLLIDPLGLADLNLFTPNTPVWAAANNWSIPGVFTVSGHGNPKNIVNDNIYLDAEELANLIRKNSKFKDQPVMLGSCNTGNKYKKEDSFAQKLANKLGVPVTAPLGGAWY